MRWLVQQSGMKRWDPSISSPLQAPGRAGTEQSMGIANWQKQYWQVGSLRKNSLQPVHKPLSVQITVLGLRHWQTRSENQGKWAFWGFFWHSWIGNCGAESSSAQGKCSRTATREHTEVHTLPGDKNHFTLESLFCPENTLLIQE